MSGLPSPSKAAEMLRNPPRGQALTARQRSYFQGLAHGWKPSRKAPKGLKRRIRS